jgi:hypothetical protein
MSVNTQSHYKGKDSLYKFAEEWQLNTYEFDIIKRIVRCRHKGNFQQDLQKTKDLIDIYLQEQQHTQTMFPEVDIPDHWLDLTE